MTRQDVNGSPGGRSGGARHGIFDPEPVTGSGGRQGEAHAFITKLERRASGGISLVGKPTGHARRAVGAWPTPESIADRLISALDEAADREPDPERKGWLRKTAAYLGNAGRDLAVEIGATAINRQMGM